MIKVYLVDDHAVVRAGFRGLLESEDDIRVVGESESGEAAYSACLESQVDVVITDISMPGEGGLSFTRRLLARDKRAKVLVVSMFDDSAFVKRAMAVGAMGYMSKSDDPDLLAEAVRALAAGQSWVAPSLAQNLMGNILLGESNPESLLTAREFEVFILLAEGNNANKVASILHLSPKTVGTHQTRIFQKLNVKTGAELVHTAFKMNLIKG